MGFAKPRHRIAVGLALSLTVAMPVAAGVSYIEAPVVDVTPLYEVHRVPVEREECWQEEVRHRRAGPSNPTATIVGGIIGGAVGNQFGGGSGRDAATVAGALLGASVGNDVSKRHPRRGYTTVEERCERVRDYQEKETLSGYRVRYDVDGNVYTTRTRHDPGETLRVRVSVEPAE